MTLELTEKDIFMLKLAFSVLAAVLLIRFLLMPQLSRRQELSMQLQEAAAARQEMEASISSIPSLKEAAERSLQELLEASENYYDAMENRQVDEILTGLALEMDLFPVSLSIDEAKPELPGAYLYSALPETGEVFSDTYILTARGNMVLLGEEENVFRFLDTVETKYPSLQIRSVTMAERTYLDADWQAAEQMEVRLTLAVYMCHRSSL